MTFFAFLTLTPPPITLVLKTDTVKICLCAENKVTSSSGSKVISQPENSLIV